MRSSMLLPRVVETRDENKFVLVRSPEGRSVNRLDLPHSPHLTSPIPAVNLCFLAPSHPIWTSMNLTLEILFAGCGLKSAEIHSTLPTN